MNRFIPSLALLFTLGGCISVAPTPKLIVTNATRESVRDVVLKNGDHVLAKSPLLHGHESMAPLEGIPSGLQLSWVDSNGKSHQHDTDLSTHVKPDFARGVYVQIETGPRVVVKLAASGRKAESDIPWSKPETWEGTPNIPGLNQN